MSPDLLAGIVAFIRTVPAIVSAFGEDLAATPPIIKFFSDWSGQTIPPMPYLVFTEPQDVETFSSTATTGGSNSISSDLDGVVAMEVYASGKTLVRQLADQVAAAINDCEDSLDITNIGVFYIRRTNRHFPIITNVGPDGNPTSFGRMIQFRYMYEQTP